MTWRDVLGERAVMEALRLRSRRGRAAEHPVCPVDIASEEGVDVRFAPLSSLEGMYAPDKRLILVGSCRPPGRRAYTCAHELGHHIFGHGYRVDELRERASSANKDDAEYVADRFAAALLMPKLAVFHAFAVRQWNVKRPTLEQVYAIACLLGVGYTTLIGYMERTLRVVPASIAAELCSTTPKQIRTDILGEDEPRHLIIVDEFWEGRSVDADVGDALLIPPDARATGSALRHAGGRVVRAMAPGIASVRRGSWCVEVRVARVGYAGLAQYRHLTDEVEEDG